MDVVVKRARDGVGQPVRGIGEDVDHLDQCIARHPERQRVCEHMQNRSIRFCPGADVVPVHDLGQFTDHAFVET